MAKHVPTGRLERLGRMAALVPRAALALARDRVQDEGRFGEQVADALGKLKAGSLKMGQILAQVADELPPGAALRLGRVYGEAPALEPGAVADVITTSLGQAPERLFAHFEPLPFAAASIGQVHRARLHDGTPVAVKVRYPGVEEALRRDLDALGGVVGGVSGRDLLFDASRYFTALREQTLAELDFSAEARRTSELRAAVANWPDLVVPKVFSAFSTDCVLTLELLDGPTLHAFCDSAAPTERQALADRLVRAVLGPIFTANRVNADAHPGNFVVLDGALGLLDFGAVVPLPKADVAGLRRLFTGLQRGQLRPRADLEAAGTQFKLPANRAEELATAITDILAPPFRGPHDHAADSVLKRMMQLKQDRPLDLMRTRPPAGLLPVIRAMVGLNHALRRLPGPLDLRPALSAVLSAAPIE